MKLTPEEKQARKEASKARRREYDRLRMQADRKKRLASMSPEALAESIQRRRDRQNAHYRRKLAEAGKTLKADRPKVEKPPKPLVIAKRRPAPAYHRWSPETEAVIPASVVVQRCPTPLPRFHVEAPSDGFASMGIGRYD